MATHLPAFLPTTAADTDHGRRCRNVVIIGAGMALLGLVMIPLAFLQNAPAYAPFMLAALTLAFLLAVWAGRSGRANLGASLIIAVSVGGNLVAVALDPGTPSLSFFLVVGALLATVLLPPVHIWTVLLICLIGNSLAITQFAPEARADEIWSEAHTNSSLIMIAVAVIGYLGAKGVNNALNEAQAARDEARTANRALAATNATLEQRVEDRTAALRQIADEQRAAAAELKASLEAQQELNRVVAELAVPVIPVSATTLVVPLIGNIDTARAANILASILGRVEVGGARTVVLDVTGVALVDTHVAGALLRIAQAARLMGAETVLAGIRPEVAQALVGLGVDLSNLHTVATLQEALTSPKGASHG